MRSIGRATVPPGCDAHDLAVAFDHLVSDQQIQYRLAGEMGAKVLTAARTSPQSADGVFVAAAVATAAGYATVVEAVREHLGGVDIVVYIVEGSSAPAGRMRRAR